MKYAGNKIFEVTKFTILEMLMVQENKISTDKSEIWIDEQGILNLFVKEDVDLDLDEVIFCFKTYGEMGIGPHNKVLQLIKPVGNALMSPEARKYVNRHGEDHFLACAIVTKSLSIRLIVNFFNSFYKPVVPFRMFKTEPEAREWLISFRKGL